MGLLLCLIPFLGFALFFGGCLICALMLCLAGLYRALRRLARETRALWSPDWKKRRAAHMTFAALGRVSLVAVSVVAVVYGLGTIWI